MVNFRFTRINDKKIELFCSRCGASVGVEHIDVLSYFREKSINEIFCFDCDSIHSDEIPEQLLGEVPYLLKVGDRLFHINPWATCRGQKARIELFQDKVMELWNKIEDLQGV